MKNYKIIWRVCEPSTGRYRSFNRRGWPMAHFNSTDGPCAAALYSESEYVPADVKTGNHSEIKVCVADYRARDQGFVWRTLVKRAATLDEAKELVKNFYKSHEVFLPKTL